MPLDPADRPNFVCGPVQVVWHKFARYWDVEIREVPMAPGRYAMDPASMLERVDENTIMVVPTFGVTYTGAYERVLELSQALDKLHAERGLDVDIHVDAASGGFLAPFCAPEVAFDFRLPRVRSISASGHKFGLAPLGAGWVIWRDAAELPEDLIFHVNYLGGDMPVFQINFSRPAGQIIASYYNFLRLGHEGYRHIHQASYDIGQYLAAEIVKAGPFELLCDSNPNTGIPTVTWRIREGEDPGYTLFDLADRLRGHEGTIGERLERDLAAFQKPLPAPYDACEKKPAQVGSLSLVRYRRNDYSVPTAYGHREVLVRGYVHQVVISCGAEVIARHPRSYEREDFVFDPLHYLALLEQKIGALDQAAPLAGWDLPKEFTALRCLLEARMGKPGKREYVQVLRLLEMFCLEDVLAGVRSAIERGAIGFDAVKHLVLCRIERRPPRLDLTVYPYLPHASVATTSARAYMDLLAGATS